MDDISKKIRKKEQRGRDAFLENTFYYKATEFGDQTANAKDKYLHATNVILLGSMVGCDQDGIPQLHQLLPATTFKTPPDSVEAEDSGELGEELIYDYVFLVEVIGYTDVQELIEILPEDRRTDCLYTTAADNNKYTVDPNNNRPIFSGVYYQYELGYGGPYDDFKPVQDQFPQYD